MKTRSTLFTAGLLCLAAVLSVSNVLAQQKQQVSFTIPGQNTKYIVSENVDVGDVPNHIVRLFDNHATLPNNAVTIDGLKLIEVSARGTGDIADGNGNGAGYHVFVAENGDKFFSRSTFLVQSPSGKLIATWVGHITGGTGKFRGLEGIVRQVVTFDPRPGGVNGDSQYEIEYSLGK